MTLVPSPTPLPTWASGFQLGAFVREISGNSELMLTSGITWASSQTRIGSETRPLIFQAHDNGLKILLTVIEDDSLITDGDYQTEYVSFLASLTKQGADAIEVGFEPNFGRNAEILTPTQYTNLLCEAYAAIKDANPDTLVVSGAPAPSSFWGDCTSKGCDDLLWVQGLAEAGAADCLDFVGVRYNSGTTSPSARDGNPIDNGTHPYSLYFSAMVEHYDEAFQGLRPLAFTMFGYLSPEGYEGELPAHFAWAKSTTTANQAAWITEGVQMSIENGKIGMIVIYNLDSTGWGDYRVDGGYAIIRPDGSCPTCDALQELLSQQ